MQRLLQGWDAGGMEWYPPLEKEGRCADRRGQPAVFTRGGVQSDGVSREDEIPPEGNRENSWSHDVSEAWAMPNTDVRRSWGSCGWSSGVLGVTAD